LDETMKSKLFTSKEDKDEDKERVLSDEMKTRSTQSGNSDKSGRLPKEIDWEHLDKSKFFLNGIGAFSLATLALYPLSVVKTRQMLEGTKIQTPFKDVVIKDRGFKGLYAGFGTVVFGAIPLRMVYLSTLEYTKGNARALCEKYEVEEMYYGIADAAGGATASFVSQTLGTPIDIISQRQQVSGLRHANFTKDGTLSPSSSAARSSGSSVEASNTVFRGYRNGFHAFKEILRNEGARGLYRGYVASVATLVPSSAIWWGFYGTYSRVFWNQYTKMYGGDDEKLKDNNNNSISDGEEFNIDDIDDNIALGVTALSGLCAGMSSGFITTPLDAVKTRFQVLSGQQQNINTSKNTSDGGGGNNNSHTSSNYKRMTIASVAKDLYRKHGIRGYFRGVLPRMASVSLWGTTMVSLFEALKRSAAAESAALAAAAREEDDDDE
jgi:solute carrier family 25 protein 44